MIKSTATLLVLMSLSAHPAQALMARPVAAVAKVKGSAWIMNRKNKKSLLLQGEMIPEGSTVYTSGKSDLYLKMGDRDVVVKLSPRSEAKLFRRANKDYTVELKKGGILSMVKNPEKRPDHFNVKTQAAVMGVRGTVFFVQSRPGKNDFICTCAGTVAISSPDGKSTTEITSKHHDHPKTLKPGEAAIESRLEEAPMGSDHADSDAEELATMLN